CGLHQWVVAGVIGERAVAAEGPDRAVDQPVVARTQLRRTEAEPPRGTRAQALHEHGRALRQTQQGVPPCPCGQVEGERALARVRREEHHAPPAGEGRPPRARLVAAARMLDLDHVGAEGSEDLRAIRAGQRARQIEHPDALERMKARQAMHATDQASLPMRGRGDAGPYLTQEDTFSSSTRRSRTSRTEAGDASDRRTLQIPGARSSGLTCRVSACVESLIRAIVRRPLGRRGDPALRGWKRECGDGAARKDLRLLRTNRLLERYGRGRYWARTSDPQLVETEQRSRRIAHVRPQRMVEPDLSASEHLSERERTMSVAIVATSPSAHVARARFRVCLAGGPTEGLVRRRCRPRLIVCRAVGLAARRIQSGRSSAWSVALRSPWPRRRRSRNARSSPFSSATSSVSPPLPTLPTPRTSALASGPTTLVCVRRSSASGGRSRSSSAMR